MKTTNTTTYWRSLADLEGSEEVRQFIENEFPEQAEELKSPLDRRRFMQLMGASLAFAGVAGAAGCRRWEEERIVPLSRRPNDYVPGVPNHYATAMELGGVATGLLVTSYEGRPVKIEGNPDHPFSGAGSTAFAQASILGVYDPDRSQSVRRRDGGKELRADWVAFEDFARQLGDRGPQLKLAVLSESTSSPTMLAMRAALAQRFAGLRWYEWEPLSRDNEREGMKQAFGDVVRPVIDIAKADVVLALDADMFVDHPAALGFARGFAARRRPDDGDMNRLYSVESVHSSTGAIADHRLPLRSELILPFLMALDAKLNGGAAPAAAFLSEGKIPAFLDALAADFKSAQGRAAIVVGHRQPPAVHALAAKLNEGATGQAVNYIRELDGVRPTHAQSIKELVDAMNGNQVDALVILGGNPVYDAPVDLGFAEALGKVADTIHLSDYHDETSAACSWHLPRAHYLESWADGLAWDGTYTLTQPVIEPLYNGRTPLEILGLLAGRKSGSGKDLIREIFAQVAQAPLGGTEKAWRKALHDGFLTKQIMEPVAPTVRSLEAPQLTARQLGGLKPADGVEVTYIASSHSYDGRFANNAWLQETPDFMTKATWDAVALVGPATANDLGISNGEKIKLSSDGRQVTAVAYVMPGQAPHSIALELGYGRTRAGKVAGHDEHGVTSIGHNVYPLRAAGALWVTTGQVKGTGDAYDIATTQDHWNIDKRGQETIQTRMGDLFREGTLDEYQADGQAWQEKAYPRHLPRLEVESLWDPPATYETGDKWGMATDLSKCIGCNACAVACQAENNVPVVGKREVMRSREMAWIRIDRYFSGDIDDPKVVHQPVTCQQCEKAPCEQVCPVGATVHSDEGLNDMSYNRCVGTRYCLNNCPYKVRRFNFLDYHKEFEDSRNKVKKLLFNPEVTVRSRGVMEKCTFCVQRIAAVKIPAKNEGRVVEDGDIQTACQQACPTGAIIFGNLNDPEAQVTKLHESERAYAMLAEFNVRPRNLYLARISNPNPELAPKKAEKKSH